MHVGQISCTGNWGKSPQMSCHHFSTLKSKTAMAIILWTVSFFVLVIAIRAWFIRKEIAKIIMDYNEKRKKIKEESERRHKEHIIYRGIAISRKLNSLTADELKDPKKIEKAIKEAC